MFLGSSIMLWMCVCLGTHCQAQPGNSTDTILTDSSKQAQVKRIQRDSLKKDSIAVNYSLNYERQFLNSLNETHKRDTSYLVYQRLKKRMYKHRLTKGIFDFLFRDPYPAPVTKTLKSPQDPYLPLEGRYIGNIYIKRQDPFGPRIDDTLCLPINWLERVGNAIHSQTREYVIQKSLLFKKGNTFISPMISDNERILRQLPNLLDARIYPMPRSGPRDSVDILVITQDVWSLTGGLGTDFGQAFDGNLTDYNFMGLGHSQTLQVSYNAGIHPYTEQLKGWGFSSIYQVPYIAKTFVTGQLEYTEQWNKKRHAAMIYRNFLTPDMKYAGGAELSHNRLYIESDPLNKNSKLFPLAYDYGSFWLGRSFRPPWVGDRTRLVVAGRMVGNYYQQRPEVRTDTNQLYQHRWLNLYSVGLSTRKYLRDVMIYGFGRTEDVPYGSMFSVTAGIEHGELYTRNYMGFKASYGKYYNHFGYALFSLTGGGYLRSGHWEQGILSGEINYFSKLLEVRSAHMRQFVNIRYTQGLNRFPGEIIDINSNNGIRGINNAVLRGEQSLVVNLETVLFTPLNIMGFQVALFGYADIGWVGENYRSVFSTNLYKGYGIGIRIRNENMTFNTFQFRIGLYQNIPVSNTVRTEFSELPRTRLPDFDIGVPMVVPFGNLTFQ